MLEGVHVGLLALANEGALAWRARTEEGQESQT